MVVPNGMKELEEKIESLKKEKESHIKSQDFEKAAHMRDVERETRTELEEIKKKWSEERDKATLVIGYDEVAKIVSQWTKIPLVQLEEEETKKLLKMEDHRARSSSGRKSRSARSPARCSVPARGQRIRAGLLVRSSFWDRRVSGHCGRGLGGIHVRQQGFPRADRYVPSTWTSSTCQRLIGAPPGYVGYEEGDN